MGELLEIRNSALSDGKLLNDYDFRDASTILNLSLAKLGCNEKAYTDSTSEGSQASIIKYSRNVWAYDDSEQMLQNPATHFQAGNSVGGLVNDPWGHNISGRFNPSSRKVWYYVHLY
jgi:hypothetical protein